MDRNRDLERLGDRVVFALCVVACVLWALGVFG